MKSLLLDRNCKSVHKNFKFFHSQTFLFFPVSYLQSWRNLQKSLKKMSSRQPVSQRTRLMRHFAPTQSVSTNFPASIIPFVSSENRNTNSTFS
jgi:hypothetical protein